MSDAILTDAVFSLINEHAPADAVRVASFRGTEAASEAYAFDIVCHAVMGAEVAVLESTMPGSRASLRLAAAGDGAARFVHGIVSGLSIQRSLHRNDVELLVRLEPRLSLLGLNTHSRIFQQLSVVDVVKQLLDGWGIPHATDKLSGTYRKRTYLTQYQETDYAFMQRVLASEGIFYFFEHAAPEAGAGEERVVLCDSADLYPPIEGESRLRFSGEGDALLDPGMFDHVTALARTRRLRSKRALLGDYDFRNPGLAWKANTEAAGVAEVHAASDQLRAYHHHVDAEIEGTSGSAQLDKQRARAVLEGHRADALVAVGQSKSRRLAVGHTFDLEGHPVEHLNSCYAVTRIEHQGRVPELTGQPGLPTYENRFECVPRDVPCRPAPIPQRRRQVAETATVVAAGNEEISTDDSGRIKVKFHWDLSPAKDAGASLDGGSCWLRVVQPWAGTHYGFQFIPRVGDEVIVTFLGGDVDRPVVTGSLYNGTHPPPFALPDDKATSGFRTQSTPGGGGFNELSFSDRKGEERVFLRAERDHVEEVGRDHKQTVKRNQLTTVTGAQSFTVALGQTMQIGAAQIISVLGNQQMSAAGSGVLSYGGDADMQVGQQYTLRVDGREHKEVKLASNEIYRDDQVTRILGHRTMVVGQHDARRAYNLHVEGSSMSYTTGSTLIQSDKDIELRVGESAIRLTPDGIEISSPQLRINGEGIEVRATDSLALEATEQATVKSKKILMASESAFVGLAKEVKVKGEMVKLNCTDDPVDDLKEPEPVKLTTIELADEDGKPLANQRFVIVLPDGAEQTGALDKDGKAELVLPESGEIIFPDVHDPRPA